MSNQDLFGDDVPADALEHMQSPEIRAKWPKALADLVSVIEAAHLRAGDAPEVAQRRAFVTVRALSNYAGGRQLYMPKGEILERALRDREIWSRYNGRNIDDLVAEFDLGFVQVYSIIAEQRALHRQRIQPSLF
ncbi:MAG: transcriptional regulator [Gammaproteobacteria bacterium]|nr:transcriptional regulator [Gammaproteobacteria bacterium]MBU1859366.1 transcriptional regulator [Gammaproteobacteria bacterium]